MRWPWERVPWGRGRGSDGPDAPVGDVALPTGPAPVESASTSTGLPAAWTRLPPLQRSITDAPAVAPPAAFRSSLTTHQNPSFLAPLGHLVDPDGPAGVVGGLASSVGGPIPYEGTAELRVPDRPAPKPAPAVQRRMATLQPTVTAEPAAPPPGSGGPEFLPETSTDTTAGAEATDQGAAVSAPPSLAPLPAVVQRTVAAAPRPGDPGTLDATSPPVSGSGSRPDPAPLTVPVQRAVTGTADPTSSSPRRIADAAPVTLRPVVPPPAADDGTPPVHAATQTAPTPHPAETSAAGELVVARSVAEPSTEPASLSGDDVVGLVADRSPLASPSPSPSDDSDSPEYASDHPAPLTLATAPAPASAPAVQRSGPTLPSTPRLPTGLDEQGYPPLIARSVQRSAVDRPPSTGVTSGSDSGPTSQAPLSPFTAAISALHDSPEEAADDRGATAEDLGASREPDLVVARRVMPDAGGQLPHADVHLQRDVLHASHPRPRRGPVQRSLITGRSPLPPPQSTLPTAATIPAAPAVQRIRYEDAPSAGRRQVDRPSGPDAAPTSPAPVSAGSWSAPAAGPASSAGVSWSIQRRLADGGSGGTGPVSGPSLGGRPGAAPSSPPVPLEAGSAAPAVPEFPSTPVARAQHTASASPAPSPRADEPPLIQRRFDAPAPSSTGSAPLAPPTAADPPALAVSSRTVGLAEMFALAAAQSADGATVQRSAETEVQSAAVDSAPTASAASSSAAPAGPSSAAAPLSGAELEEMARRLYEPLSARLRNELWQDRERSGLLTDLRP